MKYILAGQDGPDAPEDVNKREKDSVQYQVSVEALLLKWSEDAIVIGVGVETFTLSGRKNLEKRQRPK